MREEGGGGPGGGEGVPGAAELEAAPDCPVSSKCVRISFCLASGTFESSRPSQGFAPWSSGSELVSPACQRVPAGRFCAVFLAGMVAICRADVVEARKLWAESCG